MIVFVSNFWQKKKKKKKRDYGLGKGIKLRE